ncbi:MAG: hypothetical protein GY769_22500, partial [bacterium]|nr:hypothetical protein [bacterium]
LNRPFALDTEYRAGWVGRYHALRSEIGSVNLTATVGYRFSDHLSVGFGANLSRLDVELSRAIDLGSMCFALELAGDLLFGDCDARGLEPQHSDGTVGFDADSTAVGFNLGLLWQPVERLRIGLAYRSKIAHELGGRYSVSALDPRATAFAAGAAGVVDSAARGSLDLPDFESFSIFWRPVKRWELVGDWTRTGWSSLDELRIRLDSSVPDEVTTVEARDSVGASVGSIFAATERWRLRFGFAAEETAGSGARRQSARFPDAPRQWYALGFDFAVSERLDLSLGYAIVDADESGIEKLAFPRSEDFLRGSLRGTYGLGADVLSLQVRLRPR